MTTRQQILKNALSKSLALGAATAAISGGALALGAPASAASVSSPAASTRAVSTRDNCSNMKPDPKPESQYKTCGKTNAAHVYKSNAVVGNKRCYYFLTTQWNPCALPAQTNTSACKAL